MTTMTIDRNTGEILPSTIMVRADKAPSIVIDINDVAIYHSEPGKLVDKIRAQAGFAVFDIGNQKGRDACRTHAANIIKCIAPAMNASKALAAEAQKVVKQDLAFRRVFEADVREIADFHRQPLTEYENELQRVKDEHEALVAAKLAEEERIKQEAEEEKRRLFEEEKAKFQADRLAMEQEAQRLSDDRAKIDLEIKLRAEAEQQRLVDEKRHSEQLERQAVKDATEKAEHEARQHEEAACIAEESKLEEFRRSEMVTISKSEYDELLRRVTWLACLEAAGVDDWDGIDYATALLEGATADFHNA